MRASRRGGSAGTPTPLRVRQDQIDSSGRHSRCRDDVVGLVVHGESFHRRSRGDEVCVTPVTDTSPRYSCTFMLVVAGFVEIWLARLLVIAVVFAAIPVRAGASTTLAPLPATVRVNISLLGT